MTNLPITSNTPQLVNTAQVNSATDAEMVGTQAAEPFASLLARQIDEADSSGAVDQQTAPTVDPNLKDKQDRIVAISDITADPTNALAAMLQQIPHEMRTHASNGAAGNMRNSMGIDKAAHNVSPLAYTGLDMARITQTGASATAPGKTVVQGETNASTAAPGKTVVQGETNASTAAPGKTVVQGETNASAAAPGKTVVQGETNASAAAPGKTVVQGETNASTAAPGKIDVNDKADTTDQQLIAAATNQNAIKHNELPSSLTSSVQNTNQAINSSMMSSMLPNMLAGNKITDSPQTIATPLNSSMWADDFSQKISWMSTQQNQVAELHLNPPDLGPLKVTLKISDNQATALFTSPHSAVRDAVENAMPKLREMLADNGIMLGNATVSDQPPRDRSADGTLNQGSGIAKQRDALAEEPKPAALSAAQVPPIRRHNGMVDTFA